MEIEMEILATIIAWTVGITVTVACVAIAVTIVAFLAIVAARIILAFTDRSDHIYRKRR